MLYHLFYLIEYDLTLYVSECDGNPYHHGVLGLGQEMGWQHQICQGMKPF